MQKNHQLMTVLVLLVVVSSGCATFDPPEPKGRLNWPHDFSQDVKEKDEARLKSYAPQFKK